MQTSTFKPNQLREFIVPGAQARLLLMIAWLAGGLLIGIEGRADVATFRVTEDGDAAYAWNSKYGPYGYTAGGTDLGVGLYMGAPYGNDYTVGILEIPLSGLLDDDLVSAQLQVYSNGFGTSYYYGSAALFWIAPSVALTGNPVADGVGSNVGGVSNELTLWDGTQGAGWFSFDVTAHVRSDLAAGRGYSTYVLGGSRDTYGSIRAAEYAGDFGARIVATTVPEPSSLGLILLYIGAALGMRRATRVAELRRGGGRSRGLGHAP